MKEKQSLMQRKFELPPSWISSISNRIGRFEQKIAFDFEFGEFRIHTARSSKELLAAIELRTFVFKTSESGNASSLDHDGFDLIADHILLTHKPTNQIVGTYRMISSRFSKSFYTESEFDLSNFIKPGPTYLELGRACLDPAFQKTGALNAVWMGLARYISAVNADYLFGCSSVFTLDDKLAHAVAHMLARESGVIKFDISPKKNFRHGRASLASTAEFAEAEIKKYIPGLLRSYIRAGARIALTPAFDHEFRCADIFTCLDMKEIKTGYVRRYFENGAQ